MPVAREQVVVEHRPVEPRAADSAVGSDAETVNVPVREEALEIEKRPVVTGEVRVRKESVEDRARVSETVRREVPDVQAEGDARVRADDASR